MINKNDKNKNCMLVGTSQSNCMFSTVQNIIIAVLSNKCHVIYCWAKAQMGLQHRLN